jgi:hypothetical protein
MSFAAPISLWAESANGLVESVGSPECHSAWRLTVGSRRHIDPLEVYNLIFLLKDSEAPSTLAHGFTSGAEPRRRAPHTLFGSSWTPTGAP